LINSLTHIYYLKQRSKHTYTGIRTGPEYMSAEMPSKQNISIDRSLFDSIDSQVQNQTLSKEQAYDQLSSHIKCTILDLPSISKLWETNDSKDPPSVYSKIQLILTKLVEVLQQHKTAVRIGHVFKDHFMAIWTQVLKELECHDITTTIRQWIAENVTKPILQVRDIRWILKDFEGYIIRSHLFEFNKYGIVPKSESMSRDNFYIVKKYIEDEEESKSSYYNTKWTICNECSVSSIESIQIALEKGAPFNVRDQPSNQTDELWVALKNDNVKVIKFLCEYEEKEGRPIVFTEEHAKYMRKLGHLDTLRTLMPQFLTKEEKDEANPPPPVPTLDFIDPNEFRKIQKGPVKGELISILGSPQILVDYTNKSDSVILFYSPEFDIQEVEAALLEVKKRFISTKLHFVKTTFFNDFNNCSRTHCIGFFRNGCQLYRSFSFSSEEELYIKIQFSFYQVTIIPENEEFGKLRKKFENIPSNTKMTMTDVKEYFKYNQLKTQYENLTSIIFPCDNTKADEYWSYNIFEDIKTTEEDIIKAEKSRSKDSRDNKVNVLDLRFNQLIGDREQLDLLLEGPKAKSNNPFVIEQVTIDEVNDATSSRFRDTCFEYRLKKRQEFITIPEKASKNDKDKISEYNMLTKDDIDKIFESQL
jgi:hypothetical protein